MHASTKRILVAVAIAVALVVGFATGINVGNDNDSANADTFGAQTEAIVSENDEAIGIGGTDVDEHDDVVSYDVTYPEIADVWSNCSDVDGDVTIHGYIDGLSGYTGYYDVAVDRTPDDLYVDSETYFPTDIYNNTYDSADFVIYDVDATGPVSVSLVDYDGYTLDYSDFTVDACAPAQPPASPTIYVTPVCDTGLGTTGQIVFTFVNTSNDPMDVFLSFLDAYGNVDDSTYYSFTQQVPAGQSLTITSNEFGYPNLVDGDYTTVIDVTDAAFPNFGGSTQNPVYVPRCDLDSVPVDASFITWAPMVQSYGQ